MTRFLVTAFVLVSLGMGVVTLVWAGLVGMARLVRVRPRAHADLDPTQRQLTAELEKLYKLPAFRKGRVS